MKNSVSFQYKQKRVILLFLLFFPLFKPEAVDALWPILDIIYNLWRVLVTLYIGALYIKNRKLPSRLFSLVLMLEIWILIITGVNGSNIRAAFFDALISLSALLIVDFYKNHPAELVKSLFHNMEWLNYANLVSIFMYYPKGMFREYNTYYFLSNRTRFIIYVLFLICTAMLNLYMFEKQKIRSLLSILAGCATIFITWSAGSIIVLFFVFIVYVFLSLPFRKYVTFKLIMIFAFILDLLVTFSSKIMKSEFVISFITNVLHRSPTMSHRSIIWEGCHNIIGKNILYYGYGSEYNKIISLSPLNESAHNQYYDLILQGGFICLFLFFIIFFSSFYMAARLNKKSYVRTVFLMLFTGLLVNFITESYLFPALFVMIALAYYASNFENPINKK